MHNLQKDVKETSGVEEMGIRQEIDENYTFVVFLFLHHAIFPIH